MSLPYTQYHLPDDTYDTEFRRLLQAEPVEATKREVEVVRYLCATMRDDDVYRIMGITNYGGGCNYGKWRKRASKWSAREARYVINCLRFEHYQAQAMEALNIEDVERKAMEEKLREQHAAEQQQQADGSEE